MPLQLLAHIAESVEVEPVIEDEVEEPSPAASQVIEAPAEETPEPKPKKKKKKKKSKKSRAVVEEQPSAVLRHAKTAVLIVVPILAGYFIVKQILGFLRRRKEENEQDEDGQTRVIELTEAQQQFMAQVFAAIPNLTSQQELAALIRLVQARGTPEMLMLLVQELRSYGIQVRIVERGAAEEAAATAAASE